MTSHSKTERLNLLSDLVCLQGDAPRRVGGGSGLLPVNETHSILSQSLHFLGCKMGSCLCAQRVVDGFTVRPERALCLPPSLPQTSGTVGWKGQPTWPGRTTQSPHPPAPLPDRADCQPGLASLTSSSWTPAPGLGRRHG